MSWCNTIGMYRSVAGFVHCYERARVSVGSSLWGLKKNQTNKTGLSACFIQCICMSMWTKCVLPPIPPSSRCPPSQVCRDRFQIDAEVDASMLPTNWSFLAGVIQVWIAELWFCLTGDLLCIAIELEMGHPLQKYSFLLLGPFLDISRRAAQSAGSMGAPLPLPLCASSWQYIHGSVKWGFW